MAWAKVRCSYGISARNLLIARLPKAVENQDPTGHRC
jgi:hypothetical protein